jgi:hypothetical protein
MGPSTRIVGLDGPIGAVGFSGHHLPHSATIQACLSG